MHVAVVGGGITGLGTALLLAAEGHRITLLDAQPELGGVARPVTYGGHTFSPGPQFVWGFDDDGPGRAILAKAGVDVPFRTMSLDFEQLSIGEGPFRPVHGGERASTPFESALDRLGEAEAVIAHGATFRRSGAAMLRAVALSGAVAAPEQLELLRARHESVAELAARHRSPAPTLRRVLYSQGIFAESLRDLSAVVFAAARKHLVRPLHVPKGGMATLVSALIDATLRHPRIDVHLGCGVRAGDQDPSGHRLMTDTDVLGPFDHVVACCSPAVVSRITGRPLAFEPSHSMAVACLAVQLTEASREALRGRNFTWYRSDDDVEFRTPPGSEPQYVNFVCPTLNGGEDGREQVICAYVPADRTAGADLDLDATVRRTLDLLGRVTTGVEVVDTRAIGPAQWTRSFGAFEGAIYGRRLTAASLQRSALDGLPRGWSLAHSGAGIPGVLGCLQMAAAAAEEVAA